MYIKSYETFNERLNDFTTDDVLYHATNSTWETPEFNGLGFHLGTLKAAKDRIKSFRLNINPHIKMYKLNVKSPLYIDKDYIFHNNLSNVVNKLYKDKILDKADKDFLIGNIYSNDSTFDNLRKILNEKYGYDSIVYKNNIEDRGSLSYIAFYYNQLTFLGIYE